MGFLDRLLRGLCSHGVGCGDRGVVGESPMSARVWQRRREAKWYLHPAGYWAHIPMCRYLHHYGNTGRIQSARCRRLGRITKRRSR